jgi:hypothetical protein
MKRIMIKDRITRAAVLGAIAPLAGWGVSRLLVSLGFGLYDTFQLDSVILTQTRPMQLQGFIVNIYAGGLTAVLLYLFLEKFSKECVVFKAIGMSALAWFFVECFATAYFEGKTIPLRPLDDYITHNLGAVANGIALGILFKIFLYRKQRA